MRIAILILLIFFVYRHFRKKKGRDGSRSDYSASRYYTGESFEEMVEDPNCKVFVQKGRAIKARIGSQTYYFCSKECRDKYIEKLKSRR